MAFETRIINISGMTCAGCVKSVHSAVTPLEGVQSIDVNLDDNLATVTFDKARVSLETITEAIEDAGFDTSVQNS